MERDVPQHFEGRGNELEEVCLIRRGILGLIRHWHVVRRLLLYQ
jgi:hypothetical protein